MQIACATDAEANQRWQVLWAQVWHCWMCPESQAHPEWAWPFLPVSTPGSAQKITKPSTLKYGLVSMVVFGWRLNLMILEVFSYPRDSMILNPSVGLPLNPECSPTCGWLWSALVYSLPFFWNVAPIAIFCMLEHFSTSMGCVMSETCKWKAHFLAFFGKEGSRE